MASTKFKKESFCYESSNSKHAFVRRSTVWDKSNTCVHRVGKENAFSVFDRSEFLCVESCGHSERIKSETLTIKTLHRPGHNLSGQSSVCHRGELEAGATSAHMFAVKKKGVSPTTSVLTCHLLRHYSSVLIPLSRGCWARQMSRFYRDVFSSHHENCKISYAVETNLICLPRDSCVPLSHYIRRVD